MTSDSAQFFKNLGTLSVSGLTDLLKGLVENCFDTITLEGEVSGFKVSGPGHWYFTLKDDRSAISANIWASVAARLSYMPKNGDKVHVTGRLGLYEARGTYSLICSTIKPVGLGDILLELERRKKAYEKEGLFDASHKKPIDSHPSKVAVITALNGAALQDILQVLQRRASNVDVIILPSAVQGQGAGIQLAGRIRQVNEFLLADVIILGRGGGSVEDLLPFSDDAVVRAVYESEIPIISAVGHEVDWALCDWAADLRAPTPSAAAELVCSSVASDSLVLAKASSSLKSAMGVKMQKTVSSLDMCRVSSYKRSLNNRVDSFLMRFDYLEDSLTSQLSRGLDKAAGRLELAGKRLGDLSPIAVLNRGYSIVESQSRTVRSYKEVTEGAKLKIRTRDGVYKAIAVGEDYEV